MRHEKYDANPSMRDGMLEESWTIGPPWARIEATHAYVKTDRRYGNWVFNVVLAWRGWRGPWFNVAFGSGAQDWDDE